MMKHIPVLLTVLLLAGCGSLPIHDAEMKKSFAGNNPAGGSPFRNPASLKNYLTRLSSEGRNWNQHGIYIETLKTSEPVAMLNENYEYNPASVTKLATSLAALDKLGKDYKFSTELRTDGEINENTGELSGDLILVSGGDPSFSISDAQKVGDALRKKGIRRVRGGLVVVGPFTCNENSSTRVSAEVFRRQSKIEFGNPIRYETFLSYQPRGQSLVTLRSDSLLRIIQYLNAYSVNSMADMLGSHVGGPEGIQKFLIEKVGVPANSVYISYSSGLEVNRLTPRDTVKMLREMIKWLENNGLDPSSVMSVAGVDSGTLRGRFSDGNFAGSVVAKTGTLYSTDSGVAALAGIMYTRKQGPLLFAVYDMAEGKRVTRLRKLQDEFLKEVIKECGGPMPIANRKNGAPAERPESKLILALQ